MKLIQRSVFALAAVVLVAVSAPAATLISKPPDQGPFWQPIGNSGSYVYADCFIAPAGPDVLVWTLGTWLAPLGSGQHSIVTFEIWGDSGGPDCNNSLATTASFQTQAAGLNLHTLPVVTPAKLTPGNLYWFVINATGGNPNLPPYQTGAHTQNSVYQDNCTFWFSNDPGGCAFDGQNFIPEMAFEVLLMEQPVSVATTSFGAVKNLYR